jgi:prepilin-type N-terminal cleavage/methylation domain-containing protein
MKTMKTALKITKTADRGFTLLELIIVMSILTILIAIAAMPVKNWIDKSRAEGQLRTLHADLLQTRAKAMQENKQYFVVINANNYQIVKDANENGTNDDPVVAQKALFYPATSSSALVVDPAWSLTLIMDPRGVLSTSLSSLNIAVNIFFDTANAKPEYDCFQLYATRINLGRKNVTDCVAR